MVPVLVHHNGYFNIVAVEAEKPVWDAPKTEQEVRQDPYFRERYKFIEDEVIKRAKLYGTGTRLADTLEAYLKPIYHFPVEKFIKDYLTPRRK